MKATRTFVVLLVLALLLSTIPMTILRHTQAAEPQVSAAPAARIVDSLSKLNGVDAAEPPFLSAFSVSSASPVAQASVGNWHIECVDCPKQFGELTDRSLQLDTDGHPHIAYGEDHLYYAWHDGMQWHYGTVDDSPGVGTDAALALDEAGRPHISYFAGTDGHLYDNADGSLKYAWHDGSSWHIETVDTGRVAGRYTSLALDDSGHPHISYCSYNWPNAYCHALKYTWHDGSIWHIETVESEEGVGGGAYSSLALDGFNRPHISYYDDAYESLKYTWYDGVVWHIETVDSEWAGRDTSIALDGANRPHIVYEGEGDLKHAWHDGSVWQIETVDGGEYESSYTSLALDEEGHPRISYRDRYEGGLKYAWHDGSGWHVEEVDSAGGKYTSLALDGSGRPHIGYCLGHADSRTCDHLAYTWHDGADWQTEIVDSGEVVGEHTSLALDAVSHPHISYYDSTNEDLKYAWHNGSAWQIETVDGEEGVGGFSSLALDGTGRPHITYHAYYPNFDLKYAWHDGLAWQIETVDSEGSVGSSSSLALDGLGHPHIGYYDYTNGNLKYVWHDGSAWHIETVDSAGDVGLGTSLVLDRAASPHISYVMRYPPGNELRYARHDGVNWHIETVDGNSGGVYGTSLVLDEVGQPHISYYNVNNEDLKYAWHDGTAWHIETVDPGNVDSHTSLALDRKGLPHICYSVHYPDHGLKYAWHDGTEWHIETVDSAGIVGRYASLALDEMDQPHISYYDRTNNDLKYARLMPSLFLDKQATPRDGLRNNDTLTYTLILSGPTLSVHLWDPLPASVYYVTDSITSTVAPPAVYSPTVRTVVWQGTLPTDTVGMIRFQVTPGIMGTEAFSLSQPIVNTTWLTETMSGMSASATAIANGWYVNLPLILR